MDVFKIIFAFLSLELVKVDGAVSSPEDIEACVGEDITIPWIYDDLDSDITAVLWSVNTTTNIMTYFGGGRNPQGGYNVVAANNEGSINITNAQRSNTGTYKIDISALGPSSDEVDLLVCKLDSTSLTGTITNSVMQCTASDLGEPEAQLYVKVNGEAKSSSSATVKESDKVECCISGCAAKCFGGGNEYCTTLQSCKCDCEKCKKRVWICISFSCIGIAPEVIFVVGLLIASFRKTNLVVFAAIVIVIEIISGGVCISVPAEKCCTECCENWYKPLSIVFAVVSFLVGVAGIAEFVLVLSNRIGPGRNGGNGFFCFNNGNDDGNDGGNDGGNNGHHRGRGTNSSTVHTERTDTHRGTLSDRANSEGEVSRKDVHVQEKTGDNFSGRRPMPPIPLTDKKGRGLSANYDDEHPMISVGIPDKKAGDLGPLEEESKKKKKKKKKTKNDGDEREKEENKE